MTSWWASKVPKVQFRPYGGIFNPYFGSEYATHQNDRLGELSDGVLVSTSEIFFSSFFWMRIFGKRMKKNFQRSRLARRPRARQGGHFDVSHALIRNKGWKCRRTGETVPLGLYSPTMTSSPKNFSFFYRFGTVFDSLSDEHIKKGGKFLAQKSLLKFVNRPILLFRTWPWKYSPVFKKRSVLFAPGFSYLFEMNLTGEFSSRTNSLLIQKKQFNWKVIQKKIYGWILSSSNISFVKSFLVNKLLPINMKINLPKPSFENVNLFYLQNRREMLNRSD